MGWSYGENSDGKKVGYSVKDTCNHPSCDKTIDRGLSYVCGFMHGNDEYSCDNYYCEYHKANYLLTDQGELLSVCDGCKELLLSGGEWFYDENEDIVTRKNFHG